MAEKEDRDEKSRRTKNSLVESEPELIAGKAQDPQAL